ncbi:MAG: DUF2332 family protein [Elusimicrobia bacterium]|nr:DUF2332 family protein [Elusimicrobiota bacterium]
MDKQEFIAQLDRGALTMPELPVSSSLVRLMSEQLKRGDPPWWIATLKAWQGRRFFAWTEAWGLFLSCVHYEALGDEDNPLVPFFPSCGGTDEADPSGAFSRFLSQPPKSFLQNLKYAHRRVFVEGRAPLWILPAALFFQSRDLPFYLVEVNAGAGLNLAADLLVPQKGFLSDLIAARIGLDPRPLELEDLEHRRWLNACLMPDQGPLIAALDRAMEAVLERQRKEAAFIQLAPCDPELAPRFLAKNVPAEEDVGLLVFNMGATGRMSDADYRTFSSRMAEMMKPWGTRALWVEVESVRGEMYSMTYQLLVHRFAEGRLATHVMARFDFAARKTSHDPQASAQFLK